MAVPSSTSRTAIGTLIAAPSPRPARAAQPPDGELRPRHGQRVVPGAAAPAPASWCPAGRQAAPATPGPARRWFRRGPPPSQHPRAPGRPEPRRRHPGRADRRGHASSAPRATTPRADSFPARQQRHVAARRGGQPEHLHLHPRRTPAGSASPAARQLPPVSAKTPATPGRSQLPPPSGHYLGRTRRRSRATSPHSRPGCVAASAYRVVSADHCPAAAARGGRRRGDVAVAQQGEGLPGRGRRPARPGRRPESRRAGRASSSGPRRCWWPAARRPAPGWAGTRRPARCPPPASDQAAVVGHALRGDQGPAAGARGPHEQLPEVVLRRGRPAHDRDRPGALRGDQRGGQRRGRTAGQGGGW